MERPQSYDWPRKKRRKKKKEDTFIFTKMVKSLAPVLPLTFFALCIVTFPTISEAHGLSYLEKVCKRAVKRDNLISYDFCLTTLQAVPESYKTEIPGLLEITTRLTLHNLTDTNNLIRRLSSITCDELLEGQLLACESQYIMAAIPLGIFSEASASKKYLAAETLASITEYSLKCEQALQGGNATGVQASGLLSNENNNFKQLASIVKALAHFVTKKKN